MTYNQIVKRRDSGGKKSPCRRPCFFSLPQGGHLRVLLSPASIWCFLPRDIGECMVLIRKVQGYLVGACHLGTLCLICSKIQTPRRNGSVLHKTALYQLLRPSEPPYWLREVLYHCTIYLPIKIPDTRQSRPYRQVCLQTAVSDLRWELFCTYHNSHHSSHFPGHKWEDSPRVFLHTLSRRLLATTPWAGYCVRFIAEIIWGVEIVDPNNTQLVNNDHQNS